MRLEVADRFVILFYLLSVPATIYPIWELVGVYRSVQAGIDVIETSSGVAYFLLMSIFFTLFIIQIAGKRCPDGFIMRHASGILACHFFLVLFIASALTFSVPYLLAQSGYKQCGPAKYRTSRGGPMNYALKECPPPYSR